VIAIVLKIAGHEQIKISAGDGAINRIQFRTGGVAAAGAVAETGSNEHIKARKAPDANVLAKAGFDFLRPPQEQFPGNSAIVQNLLVQFDAKLVAGRILS